MYIYIYIIILYYIILNYIVIYIILYYIVSYYNVSYHNILYYITYNYITSYHIILSYIILCYIILYYIILLLYYTILYMCVCVCVFRSFTYIVQPLSTCPPRHPHPSPRSSTPRSIESAVARLLGVGRRNGGWQLPRIPHEEPGAMRWHRRRLVQTAKKNGDLTGNVWISP